MKSFFFKHFIPFYILYKIVEGFSESVIINHLMSVQKQSEFDMYINDIFGHFFSKF